MCTLNYATDYERLWNTQRARVSFSRMAAFFNSEKRQNKGSFVVKILLVVEIQLTWFP